MRHIIISESFRAAANRCSRNPAGIRRQKRRRGFTILEVMMAAAIMAFAITTSITTMQRAFLSLDTARNITIAGQIMQSEFEKMRLRDWSVIGSYSTTQTELTIDSAFTSNAFINTRFKLYRDVTEINMGTGIGMRQITLTCRWRNYDGREISRSYTSYYGQNGLYDYFYNSL
jgi:prepilin-type N-terminal cleavage/methylation domain-containing protein